MIYQIARAACWLFEHLAFRVKIEGKEFVPKPGARGYIVVANHRTNMDPLFLAADLPMQVRYMAKSELFEKNFFMNWLLLHLGAFPVERGKGDTSAIDLAEKIIREGGVLGMFPEGTRSPDGTLLRPKSGAAMIAMQTGADVLPCGIYFEGKLRFRSRVTVRFAPVIPFEDLGFTPGANSPREIKAVSRRMMEAIGGLLGEDKA